MASCDASAYLSRASFFVYSAKAEFDCALNAIGIVKDKTLRQKSHDCVLLKQRFRVLSKALLRFCKEMG
jgi:hypothetical protein